MTTMMTPDELRRRMPDVAFAIRGYNVTNLGRTPELLEHPRYGPTVASYLERASAVCSDVCGGKVDLVRRVREREETSIETYAEAIAMIMAVEQAQFQLLADHFGIAVDSARSMSGYSLGEISALIAAGCLALEDAMRIPLSLAADCAALAEDMALGVLFSRKPALPLDDVRRLCLRLNNEGQGVIGISTILAPNSILLMATAGTVERCKVRMETELEAETYMLLNSNRWPPLHTPIVWEKHIPSRAGLLMHTLPGGFTKPQPAILSMVTGKESYNDFNTREILQRWTDHPQRLWDVVYETLAMGIKTIIHVGPQPNIVPATFKRLKDNVLVQTEASLGIRALSSMVERPWLKRLLPHRTALLRAPLIAHVILEDWLLAQTD